MVKKILSFFFAIILLLNLASPANAAYPNEFEGCTITINPNPVRNTERTIENITIITGANLGRDVDRVKVAFTRDINSRGSFIGINSQAPRFYQVANGSVEPIQGLRSDGLLGAGSSSLFEEGAYYLRVMDVGSDKSYCTVSFTVVPGHGAGSCNPVPLGPAKPDSEIYLKVDDLPSNIPDDRPLRFIIAEDKDGKQEIEGSRHCSKASDLKKGVPTGTSLSTRAQDYYFFIFDRCDPDFNPLSFDINVDVLCFKGFKVNPEGGGPSGTEMCKVPTCPAGSILVGGGCTDSEGLASAPLTTTITCHEPFGCPTDKNSPTCAVKDPTKFLDSFKSGSPYEFDPCPLHADSSGNCKEVKTGLPGLTLGTSAPEIGKGLLGLLITVGGAVAFILIIITGYRLMTSGGDPEKIKAAREQLTSAIVGLLFIIFSISILSFLGFEVLRIPGFGGG